MTGRATRSGDESRLQGERSLIQPGSRNNCPGQAFAAGRSKRQQHRGSWHMKLLTDYQVRAVRDTAGLQQLEEPWTRLLNESGGGSIFASFPWNMAWWQAFGQANRLYVVVASDAAGQVRGIAPLMLQYAGSRRRLVFIGHGLSDSGDFLLPPAEAGPVMEALFGYLYQHRHEWDLLDLDEVPPYSLLVNGLQTTGLDELHRIRLPRTDSPYIALPTSWEAYTRALTRKPLRCQRAWPGSIICTWPAGRPSWTN
jgi:hypothetical protein